MICWYWSSPLPPSEGLRAASEGGVTEEWPDGGIGDITIPFWCLCDQGSTIKKASRGRSREILTPFQRIDMRKGEGLSASRLIQSFDSLIFSLQCKLRRCRAQVSIGPHLGELGRLARRPGAESESNLDVSDCLRNNP